MKTKLVVAMLLAGSSMFAETHFSIGIGVGGYGYSAPPTVTYAPPSPGPGYTWVDGYWDEAGPRRFWREGYWAAPLYRSEYQTVGPFERNRYAERRYDGDSDGRPIYGNSYSGDRNRFTGDRGQNSVDVNREQRFDGNRYSGNARVGSREVNRLDNTRTYGNSYNGNRTERYGSGSQGNQNYNGFTQR